jgi:hypothetical protein
MSSAVQHPVSDDLLAKLTRAAYQVALKHGFKSPFIDVELELWRELRAVVQAETDATPQPSLLALPTRSRAGSRPLTNTVRPAEALAWLV